MIFRFTLLLAISAAIFTSACQNKSSNENTGASPAAAAPTATPTPEASTSPSASITLPPLPDKFAEVTFTDVTSQAGIHFKHNNGAYGKKYLPETNGSGCAFLDYDNDGWQDILLINSTSFEDAPKKINSVMALYHNNRNGTFTDVTKEAGLARPIYGQGVAVGDYDNDGFVDIFVTAVGQSRLFRNNGNGNFIDVTAKAGLVSPGYFSSSAAFFDYDKDGRLDLFLCNYVEWSAETDVFCALDNVNKSYCTPEKYKGQSSRLYHNVGGKFVDVTEKAGLLDPTGKSLGVAILDYDRDGWPDIFVANDTQPNKLYRNSGKGTFTEMALTAGVALSEEGKARGGMGADFADIDGSGNPSIIVGNFSNDMLALFRNQGKGLFIDQASSSNIGQATLLSLTFGLFFFDYDLDGRQDFFMANGHVADDINKVQPKITYAMKPQLFRNEGKARFTEVTARAGRPFQRAIVARGAAYGDYDNDGDLDILLTTNGGPAYLLRNDNGNQARFVRFKTVGDKSNRDGIGAKITITLADGSKQWRTTHSGSSYCSQSELPLTFGLGRNDKIARVEIEWPSGKVDKLTDLTADQIYVLKEGAGAIETRPLPAAPQSSPTVGN
ncbi:MAG: CRTAC1 family protein [Chloracidobacterium sp.]|nr:CRTAC1 family protein [Chloracidobacterium sp.]